MVYCTTCSREQNDSTQSCRHCGERLPGTQLMAQLRLTAEQYAASRAGAAPLAGQAAATPPAAALSHVLAATQMTPPSQAPVTQPTAGAALTEEERRQHHDDVKARAHASAADPRSLMDGMDD